MTEKIKSEINELMVNMKKDIPAEEYQDVILTVITKIETDYLIKKLNEKKFFICEDFANEISNSILSALELALELK